MSNNGKGQQNTHLTKEYQANESQWICAAKSGDRAAFSKLINASSTPLRSVVKRMVGHPEDTEEIVQEAMLKAWKGLRNFREDASFTSWLCSIGAKSSIDYLRKQKTWRSHAQIAYANECASSPELGAEVGAAVSSPDFIFDTHEHIAYCFGCVARSLSPDRHAAIVLREVLGLSAVEAANLMETSESSFKHHLSNARKEMETKFEGLCTLVNKQGVCYQCKGLSEFSPTTKNEVTNIESMEERIQIVVDVDPINTLSHAMHNIFWRRTQEFENVGRGSCTPISDCGQEDGKCI